MAHTNNYCEMMLLLIMPICSSLADILEPPSWKPVEQEILNERAKDFQGVLFKLVLVGPKEYVLPDRYRTQGVVYYNYIPRQGDIYLASVPRAGHNMLSEIIYLLANKVNIQAAKAKPLLQRVPLLEEGLRIMTRVKKLPVESYPSPRTIRTQLPISLIPKIRKSNSKIIYLARNPKDVLVSTFRFLRQSKIVNFTGDIQKLWYYFKKNRVLYNPYWEHLREGLNEIKTKNTLVIYAEEKLDVLIEKVSKFLNFKNSDEDLRRLRPYLESLEQIDQISWPNVFPTDLNEDINKWIEYNRKNISFPNIPNLYA